MLRVRGRRVLSRPSPWSWDGARRRGEAVESGFSTWFSSPISPTGLADGFGLGVPYQRATRRWIHPSRVRPALRRPRDWVPGSRGAGRPWDSASDGRPPGGGQVSIG
ncbi:hypothetical protein GCM10010106_48410 [Thermopolyspora flexuosa]|nr:hypothetical protein GCM10010106_48410 [Thermopolyspora flexuosa]